ncbi:MAG TPA: PRC-barrel domain-containing protein [Chloroflexota bacterium]|jgi:sporulation protein YlmC with PRC-barrel domain
MRLKELRGLPVIDPTAARKIGTVADYQVDPASGRLAALDINGVKDGDAERIMVQRIRRVGRNAVILTGRGGATSGTTADLNERWLDNSTLVGLEVMGDDGNRIGRLVDADFDQDSLEVDAYLLRPEGFSFIPGRTRIQPAKVHACSRELMMLTTGRLKEMAPAASAVEIEQPQTISLRMPLKAEDRLPAPSFDSVPDAKPVAAHVS